MEVVDAEGDAALEVGEISENLTGAYCGVSLVKPSPPGLLVKTLASSCALAVDGDVSCIRAVQYSYDSVGKSWWSSTEGTTKLMSLFWDGAILTWPSSKASMVLTRDAPFL